MGAMQSMRKFEDRWPVGLLTAILASCATPVAGYIVLTQIGHGNRLEALETGKIRPEAVEAIRAELGVLTSRMAVVESHLPSEADLDRLKKDIADQTRLVIRAELAEFKSELREEISRAK